MVSGRVVGHDICTCQRCVRVRRYILCRSVARVAGAHSEGGVSGSCGDGCGDGGCKRKRTHLKWPIQMGARASESFVRVRAEPLYRPTRVLADERALTWTKRWRRRLRRRKSGGRTRHTDEGGEERGGGGGGGGGRRERRRRRRWRR